MASTQGHSAWLSKASQDLNQELSEMLAATSLRSYRTSFESSTAKGVKVIHSSRSVQRSRSNSPNSGDDILVKIERPFVGLSEDTGAKKQEPCSYRTGFMSNIDKKENYATSRMSSSKQQAIKKEWNAGEACDKIKSGSGVNVAELSKDKRQPKSVRHKSRSTSRSSASRSSSDSRSRSNKHLSRKAVHMMRKSHTRNHINIQGINQDQGQGHHQGQPQGQVLDLSIDPQGEAMRPNTQNQTDTDDIRHQGQGHNQGLLRGQGHTEQRDQKFTYVKQKDHLVRGQVPDQGQGPMREKQGQGHENPEDEISAILHLLIPTLLIDTTDMGTLESIPKVYVLMGNQTGDHLKRGLTVIER